ncbi:hypothetical protein AB0392_04290 [Nonomuraea angiospora]|uniref:hypothetical protein n=1 Tax=Nonomuraea angiospora TaxID=46172 RepID=UPI003450E856
MSTEDFAPLIDAAAESGSDVLFLRSCLADSIGLVRTLRSHEFRPKMVGGAMTTGRFRRRKSLPYAEAFAAERRKPTKVL